MRSSAEHRIAHRVSRDPGFRRRRTDDPFTGADRRSDPAARARSLSGVSRRHSGELKQLWACGRRLPDPGIRLAIDLSDQYSAWSARGVIRLSHSAARGRSAAHDIRCAGPAAVHPVRGASYSGSRTGAANGAEHAAPCARLVSIWTGRARASELAGTNHHFPAHSAAFVPTAVDLARRRHGRLSRRRVGLADYFSADLSTCSARRFAGGNRSGSAAADRRHRHWLNVYRTDGDANGLDRGISKLRLDRRDREHGCSCVSGATPHPGAACLDLLRGRLVHGHRDGRGASNRSGRFRTTASRHGRRHGAIFSLRGRRSRYSRRLSHSLFHIVSDRPQYRESFRQHHRARTRSHR